MAKSVSLNEFAYNTVVTLSGKLTMMLKKPVSLGMAIHWAATMLDYAVSDPQVAKMFKEKITNVMTPEEYDKFWDTMFETITKVR